jgi:hypothetical protein
VRRTEARSNCFGGVRPKQLRIDRLRCARADGRNATWRQRSTASACCWRIRSGEVEAESDRALATLRDLTEHHPTPTGFRRADLADQPTKMLDDASRISRTPLRTE